MNVKAYSWRLTAAYVWIKMLAAVFGSYGVLSTMEFFVIDKFVKFLSSIGFAPVNIGYLPTTFKISWLLIITAFKPLELIGLVIYTISFPFWAPIGLIQLSSKKKESPRKPRKALGLIVQEKEQFRLFALTTLFLFVWFLLYGGANEQRLMFPGVVLTGIFFLLLMYRQFLRVTPSSEVMTMPFGWASILSTMLDNSSKDQVKKEFKNKSEITNFLPANAWARKAATRVALLFRGRTAQRRASLFVLADFIISLIMVGAVAILFWALVIKAVAPAILPLTLALKVSASHFLPGVQPPNISFDLPQWSTWGTAATAWILFGLYIGPAGAFLPEKQRLTLKRLNESYRLFRNLTLILGIRQRFLELSEKAAKEQDELE